MENGGAGELGRELARGGEQLPLLKAPDRFTVRLRRGAEPELLERVLPAQHVASLARPHLELFEAEPDQLDAAMEEARAAPDTAFASHIYHLEEDPTTPLYLTDEVTVQFAPETDDSDIEHLTADLGLEVLKAVPGLERTYVLRLTARAQENPIKVANRLLERDEVLASEPNVVVPSHSDYAPSDSRFRSQWHLDHRGGPGLAPGSHVDATRAWDITRGERSVVLAVTDDSVDLRHIDFQGPGKIVAPRDFHDHDFNPAPGLPDDNHGTACAGVAVAEENGQGVVGAAPGCALMPVRTSGIIDDNTIEDLFEWVAQGGAAVVSCSWSVAARYFPLSIRQRTALQRAATQGRGGLGCVIVFAAGNSNRPVNGTVDEREWPGDRPSGPTRWLDGFITHPNVIAVSACTSLGRKSAYSNWGREISVCAPSNNAPPSTFPEVIAHTPGRGIVTTDRVGPMGYAAGEYTSGFGGTSSACPLVAGVAALVLSANPLLRATEVREILQSTADKIEDPDADPQLGQSFGRYDARGHSQWFGYGKVNAFRAVTAAAARRLDLAEAPGASIPDNDPAGIERTVFAARDGKVRDLELSLSIVHPYVGDLTVELIAPSGVTVPVHRRTGGSQDNLTRTYSTIFDASIAPLRGQAIRGSWKLRVADLERRDVGKLERWRVRIIPTA